MAGTYHRLQRTQDGIHIPYSFEYATEVDRLTAVGFVVTDNGKLARQLDNNSLWMLIDHVGSTWLQISLTADISNKLSSIQSGAEVNQNAISVIDVPNADIEATSKTDQISFVGGTGISIMGDAATKRITFSTIGHVSSHLQDGQDPLPLASTTQAGLFTPADKSKLNGLSPVVAGANVTITPSNGNLVISSTASALVGEIEHNSLTGLNLDDHQQYLNLARHASTLLHTPGVVVPHDALHNLTDVRILNPIDSQVLTYSNGQWTNISVMASGEPISHGSLTELNHDDHPQYITGVRHNSPAMHQFGSTIPHDALHHLTDVSISNPVNNQFLSFFDGAWTNREIGDTHAHNLSNILGLPESLNSKISVTQKGVHNGVASLDSTGKIPIEQIPSDIGAGGIISHASLSGLDADDHLQYVSIHDSRDIDASHVFRGGLEFRNTTCAAAIMCQPEIQSPFIVYRSNATMDIPVVDIISSNNKNSMLRVSRLGNVNNSIVPCVYIDDSTDSQGSSAPAIEIHARTSEPVINVISEGTGYLLSGSTVTGKGISVAIGTPSENAIELISLAGAGSDIKIIHQSASPSIAIVNNSSSGNSLKIEHASAQPGIYCVSNSGIAVHGRTSMANSAAVYAQGASDSGAGLEVIGTGRLSSLSGSGNRAVYANSNGILINQSSDKVMKKNIVNINDEIDVISTIKKMRGVFFNWNTSHPVATSLGDQREIGFIAQEVEGILPEIVGTNVQNLKSVDYSRVVAVLVEAIKIQQKQIESLENSINCKAK